jgi:hypothetical protein
MHVPADGSQFMLIRTQYLLSREQEARSCARLQCQAGQIERGQAVITRGRQPWNKPNPLIVDNTLDVYRHNPQ